jgi:hypothetical protein
MCNRTTKLRPSRMGSAGDNTWPSPTMSTSASLSKVEPLVVVITGTASATYTAVTFICRNALGVSIFVYSVVYAIAATLTGPILFLLAPVLHMLELLMAALVLRPYRVAISVTEELYDLWVFVGVALLIGAIIGLVARVIAKGLAGLLLNSPPPRAVSPRTEHRPEDPKVRPAPSRLARMSSPSTLKTTRSPVVRQMSDGKGKRKVEWRDA